MKTWLILFLSMTALLRAQTTADGFAIPKPGRVFEFPRDHGSHPEFRTEWWYVTGHLDAKDGARFGFQVTFFRQARREDGKTLHLHLAHAALLDAKTGKFMHEERLNREGWDAVSSDRKGANGPGVRRRRRSRGVFKIPATGGGPVSHSIRQAWPVALPTDKRWAY